MLKSAEDGFKTLPPAVAAERQADCLREGRSTSARRRSSAASTRRCAAAHQAAHCSGLSFAPAPTAFHASAQPASAQTITAPDGRSNSAEHASPSA